jgi:hypothetical protein
LQNNDAAIPQRRNAARPEKAIKAKICQMELNEDKPKKMYQTETVLAL